MVAFTALFIPCTWAFTAICCACSFFKCCFTGSMGPGGIGPAMAKFCYVVILGIATILAYAIGQYAESEVEESVLNKEAALIGDVIKCSNIGGDDVCTGDSAIYRTSFACVCFFTIMMIGCIPAPTLSGDQNWAPLFGEGFHRGWWGPKLLIFFALVIGFFFLPSSFFNDDIYVDVARFVSFIFLCLQVLVLIDFGYTWNQTWLERSGIDEDGDFEGSAGWLYALVAMTGILFSLSLAGIIVLFLNYQNCEHTIAFTSVTLVLIVLFTALTFFREQLFELEQASIAPAAVVAVYAVFLTWSAAESNPFDPENCRPYDDAIGDSGGEIFVGILIGTFTLVWTSYTVSNNAKALLNGEGPTEQTLGGSGGGGFGGAYAVDVDEKGREIMARDTDGYQENEDNDSDTLGDKLWIFHAIMITASFYMPMVLTNWGVNEKTIETDGVAEGELTMWIKITAQWGACLLYIWTLIAPYVLPDRDF